MQRFYAPGIFGEKDFMLEESESHHALKVLRHKAGDVLQVVDGAGHLFNCELMGEERKQCRLRVLETFFTGKPSPELHIAVAPTKQTERMEWMTEKLTELGVAGIHFIITERTERPRLKMERLIKTAISAMKQSQRLWLPELAEAVPFGKFIEQIKADDKMIAHCEVEGDQTSNAKQMLKHPDNYRGQHDVSKASDSRLPTPDPKPQTDVTLSVVEEPNSSLLLIGPEGDFTKQEIDLAITKGFTPVSLGSNILRTETAAIAAAALLCIR